MPQVVVWGHLAVVPPAVGRGCPVAVPLAVEQGLPAVVPPAVEQELPVAVPARVLLVAAVVAAPAGVEVGVCHRVEVAAAVGLG